MLPSGPTLRHALVIGVDGARFDLLGRDISRRSGPSAGPASWVPVTAYREAARAADLRVGRLLDAVRSRPGYQQEGWTTVVVTDHGHLDQGGHGGREPEVVTAWAAAAGPGIDPGGPPAVTRQEQIAPLVLAALGPLGA